MAAKKTGAKKSCRQALKFAENDLMNLPKVVGLGIVASPSKRSHRVAVYVSELPKNAKERESLPKSLPVPKSNMTVDVAILELGKIEKEGQSENRLLGKEPL